MGLSARAGRGGAPPRLQSQPVNMSGAMAPARPRRADVIASYDLGVEGFEQLWSPVILPAAAALVPWLALRDRGLVLDVGAGTGALVSAISSANPAARVIALDASGEMLSVARVRRGATAVLADAMALPVAAATVDAVVLAYVLFHLADPPAALKEAARVLRPGGRLGTVTWASERAERAQLLWNEALAEAGVPSLAPRRADAGLDSPEALGSLLRAASFMSLRIWRERLHHQWDSASFWGLATGLGVNRQRLDLIDPDARSALLTRLRAQLNQLGQEDYLWEGEVICAVGAKPETRG
jgi:SAM-dependent methyltransferase